VDFSVSKSKNNRDDDVVYLVTWHPFVSAERFLRSMAENLIKMLFIDKTKFFVANDKRYVFSLKNPS